MKEVYATECASDNRVHAVTNTGEAHLGVAPNMGENVLLSQFNEGQLGVIAVSEEVYRDGAR